MRPSRAAEFIVARFLPRDCREEVLGDLYERYRGPLPYALEAIRTVPMVVWSRIRRMDTRFMLIQATAIYMCFLAAEWCRNPALTVSGLELFRLAIPGGAAFLIFLLEEVYDASYTWLGLLSLVSSGDAYFRLFLEGWLLAVCLTFAIQMAFPAMPRQIQDIAAAGSAPNPETFVDRSSRLRSRYLAILGFILWSALLSYLHWEGHRS